MFAHESDSGELLPELRAHDSDSDKGNQQDGRRVSSSFLVIIIIIIVTIVEEMWRYENKNLQMYFLLTSFINILMLIKDC